MSDFKDLLNKTMDAIDANHYKETQEEITLHCGHKVKGYTKSLLISGTKVGLGSYITLHVCTSCAYVLNDSSHIDFKSVKSLVRKRADK